MISIFSILIPLFPKKVLITILLHSVNKIKYFLIESFNKFFYYMLDCDI